ncbi:lactate utilization protein B [Haliea sp. E17]|uniref:lactate utilization protein B n=1 Tax=Haliea sp. E17 TaxID=3401576 RepID=UPI003AACC27E
MIATEHPVNDFIRAAESALTDPAAVSQRDMLARATPLLRQHAVAEFGEFEALRQHLKRVRRHTLENLDHYLPRFELEAIRNGNQVHFADSGDEMNAIVLDICRQHGARRIAKGKSMVTEETELAAALQRERMEVVETDLGEYIIQLAGEKPAHIVGPARHKTIAQIRQLFLDHHKLGSRELDSAESLVAEARQIMRKHFLEAEVGIIGANALIAENGYSMLVTNEGNGDLCANLPRTLIVCTTFDRILPRGEDAAALQRLLARSATGQRQTCYTSYYSGPRREVEGSGPVETHIILLDNHRSDLLDGPFHEMLDCIRCGACLNHCPIFAAAGGQAYGSVYPGPMGSVLAPLLESLETHAALPDACTSCGRCEEVCPASIPLPGLLRELRREKSQRGIGSSRWRLGLRLHAWLACHPALYRWATGLAIRSLNWLGRRRGVFHRLPFASGWTGQRDFPSPQRGTFMQQYAARERHREHEQ